MRVIEIAGGPAAAFGGMTLASLGAQVIRVELPGGGSFQQTVTAEPDAATWAYLNRRKQRVSLDLRKRVGQQALVALAASADAVIEDLGPSGLAGLRLSASRLLRANRDLVVASVSPFGKSGPRAGWQASELVLQAMGGIVHSTGFEGEPGLRVYGMPAHFIGGLHAATAVFAGVTGVQLRNERGAHISISMEEAFMQHWARHIQQWAYSGHGMVREERGNGRQGFPHTVMAADGWLYVLALNADWEPLAVFLGLEEFAAVPWNEAKTQLANWSEVAPHYFASVRSKSRYDWFAGAAKMGYTFAPIHDTFAVLDSPQAKAREAFEPFELDGRTLQTPRLPFAMTMSEPPENRLHAPGDDTRAVLAAAGIDDEQLSALLASGVAAEA